MSRINGEKARSAIAKRNRTAQRVKDRAKVAALKAGAGAKQQDQSADADAQNSEDK